jgi:hypothetical protein
MPGANNATDEARAISTHFPFRRTIVVVEMRLPPNRGGIDYKESHARAAEEVRR